MMNLRRLSAQTPALLSVIFATGIFGLLAVSGPEGIRHISAALPVDIDAPSSSIGADLAAEPRPNSISSDDASPSERSLTEDVANTPSAPTPSAPVQLASVDPSDLEPVEADKAARSVEIGDCPVVDACVDRYLWALYQRTPKEDTIKVRDWRRVAVKRRGKRVMVSRAFTRYVDQDFGWKDPKAAERVGLPMMDYVIGGMDRRFKLKLFHMLRAAEAAGLAPGITSGFRDDYRQSIASGLKAASNRSYHGGSLRGGYGHGLAADVVSVAGGTRDRRFRAALSRQGPAACRAGRRCRICEAQSRCPTRGIEREEERREEREARGFPRPLTPDEATENRRRRKAENKLSGSRPVSNHRQSKFVGDVDLIARKA